MEVSLRTGSASGIQIVFLSFAVILLAVPLSRAISGALECTDAVADAIGRSVPFFLGIVVLAAFPQLRARAIAYLSKPIPEGRRTEVAIVAVAKVFFAFSFFGALALWYWLTQGSAALEQALKPAAPEKAYAEAFSWPTMFINLAMGAIVAPVVEEILFRGLLFDAWAERWGAFVATVLTSALFAAYHPHFFATFTSGVIFVCVVRRTGTLWGSIAVHSFFNLMLWYPLAGRFGMPDPERAIGDISTWGFNLACLLLAAMALPVYVWMAVRHPYPRPTEID